MKKIFLSGQQDFGNRGCEAIIRCTTQILRSKFGDVEVLVPSTNIEYDSNRWPEHHDMGVRFVRAHVPFNSRIWKVIQATPIPFIKKILWPLPIPKWYKDLIREVDIVLLVGGDCYSLDYFSFPGLMVAQNEFAIEENKHVALWGASLGPFKVHKDFFSQMTRHLSKLDFITVRETLSYEYLKEIGIGNVKLVADPAFILEKEKIDVSEFWPRRNKKGVVGINISPMVSRARFRRNSSGKSIQTVVEFITQLVFDGYSVILVPHVTPVDNSIRNNDSLYMGNKLFRLTGTINGHISIVPDEFNCCQLKYIISKCDYFIGARTHSTIASLSSLVPTISISYSTKAKGINKDLFGHLDYVIPSGNVNALTLKRAFLKLCADEIKIRKTLTTKIPQWQDKARKGADYLEAVIVTRSARTPPI